MKRRFWTQAEDEYLRAAYPTTSIHELVAHLGRSERSIYHYALKSGLKKSADYLASIPARHLTMSAASISARFKPGMTPWNKGLRGYQAGGRSKKTQFKPGNKPFGWKPVGCFRVTRDNVLQKKVSDTGHWLDWQSVHSIIWERANGKIPKSHLVVFKDGNNRNIRLDNLELISRSQNMERNSIHNYPAELKHVMRLNTKLRRTIEGKV